MADNQEDEIAPQERDYNTLHKTCETTINRVESNAKRLFGTNTNYRKKMNLPKGAPGKKEFKNVGARLRKIRTEIDRGYRSVKPKVKKVKSADGSDDKDETKGFGRLVLLSPELSKVMGLHDWGLESTADPTRCVCTHSRVTRFLSNYLKLNNRYTKIKDPEDGKMKSRWVADDTLRTLFGPRTSQPEGDWVVEGVNPDGALYTDLQKLVKHHMDSIGKGSFEDRTDEDYRVKLDDESEFAKATGLVMDLRNEMDSLESEISKRNTYIKHCRKNRDGQSVGSIFETEQKTLLVKWNEAAEKLKACCTENEFARAETYPKAPVTMIA